jgi:hypothetical protein
MKSRKKIELKSKTILIEETLVKDPDSVNYTIRYGPAVQKFFSSEPFFAEYSLDISEVPPGILNIPLLANLMPLAWAIDADVYVEELDSQYYESLLSIKGVIGQMFPQIPLKGRLFVERLVEYKPKKMMPRTAMFYSAGVDSIATFIRKRHENPYFVTVWGADVFFNQTEFWQKVKTNAEEFGSKNGIESLFIKSSLRSFINEDVISYYFGRYMSSWWHGVQHAMGLVGLCAPLAYSLHVTQFYIPSAVPTEQSKIKAHGSSHLFDNKINWSGTTVNLEAKKLWRQEKLKLIADYIRSEDPQLQIRVCWRTPVYGNCNKCEKCARTITGLLLEGVDPNEHGFQVTPDSLEGLKSIIMPAWLSSTDYVFVEWDKIKLRSLQQMDQISPWYIPFFLWMQNTNIKQLKRKKKRSLKKVIVQRVPSSVFMFIKRIMVRLPDSRKKA